jgi:hypothetical protein
VLNTQNKIHHLKRSIFYAVIFSILVSDPSIVQSQNFQQSYRFGLKNFVASAEAVFFPFRNEHDPNAGVEFKDRVVSRYMLDLGGEYRFQNLNNLLSSFAVGFDARLLFGDSRPQLDYNLSAKPIVAYLTPSVSYYIKPYASARLYHRETIDLGGYVDDVNRKNYTALTFRVGYTDLDLQRTGPLRWAAFIEPGFFLDGNGYDAEPGVGVFDKDIRERLWARYSLRTAVRASLGTGWISRFFGYADTTLYFGDNGLPKKYNLEATPLNMQLVYGIGYRFNEHIELRTMSSQIVDLGAMFDKRERLVWNGICLRILW